MRIECFTVFSKYENIWQKVRPKAYQSQKYNISRNIFTRGEIIFVKSNNYVTLKNIS